MDATVTITVPIKGIDMHMVTAIESGYDWFVWRDLVSTKDGYSKALLYYPDLEKDDVDDPDSFSLSKEFTTEDFVRGLQSWVTKHGADGRKLAQVQYIGDGEWDIDANGADAIVQEAIYGEQVFG